MLKKGCIHNEVMFSTTLGTIRTTDTFWGRVSVVEQVFRLWNAIPFLLRAAKRRSSPDSSSHSRAATFKSFWQARQIQQMRGKKPFYHVEKIPFFISPYRESRRKEAVLLMKIIKGSIKEWAEHTAWGAQGWGYGCPSWPRCRLLEQEQHSLMHHHEALLRCRRRRGSRRHHLRRAAAESRRSLIARITMGISPTVFAYLKAKAGKKLRSCNNKRRTPKTRERKRAPLLCNFAFAVEI